MNSSGAISKGDQLSDLDVSLDRAIYDRYLEVGFTRNFASSQAYNDKYGGNPDVIPAEADDGLKFKKLPGDVYSWLGFEAYELIFGLLKEVEQDASLSIDVFAYDFNEGDIVGGLEACGRRLRAIIDDSASHGDASSAESQAAARLKKSAGSGAVKRMHFSRLQHNKVFIVKRNGQPERVLFGSTNFSYRGLYIQANNALLFHSQEASALFAKSFDLAFAGGKGFAKDPLSSQWHLVQPGGLPVSHFCFSPHASSDLSLNPVAAAIDQASSSVFFSIAFLNQIKSGPTHDAIDRLMDKPVFSYGISDRAGGLQIHKPDGSTGLVDFSYLAKHTPAPFSREWSGGKGIHQHDKFVVTDFNLSTAKVFTGSSNLSPSGEKSNGDNLVMIEDPRVATSYAIEALRIFDHLHFRSNMQAAGAPEKLVLQKPPARGKPAWFSSYYDAGQQENDRLLFSH